MAKHMVSMTFGLFLLLLLLSITYGDPSVRLFIQEEDVSFTYNGDVTQIPGITFNSPSISNAARGLWGRGNHLSNSADLTTVFYYSGSFWRVDTWIDRVYCPNQNCDPYPGGYKVFAQYSGNWIPASTWFFDAVPEGSTHTWTCSNSNYHMECESIWYGANGATYYSDGTEIDWTPRNVTSNMNQSCRGQGSTCNFSADNQYWGDPFPGYSKWLIMFNCYCLIGTWVPPATSRGMHPASAVELPVWAGNSTIRGYHP